MANLSESGFSSRKFERLFWNRYFQFELNLINEKKLLSHLTEEKAGNLVLRNIDFNNIRNKDKHLLALDEIVHAPVYIEKWANLVSIEKMSHLAKLYGKQIYDGTRPEIIRKSKSLCAYLMSLYMFHHATEDFIEDNIVIIKGHELFPLLDINIGLKNGKLNIINYIYIASLLKCFKNRTPSEFQNILSELIAIKQTSPFGDPRAYPLNFNWSAVNDLEPVGFEIWQKSFNEEDIVFFFKELNKVHQERRDFWLQYKSSPDKVILVLDSPTYKQLYNKFQNNDKALEIVKRAYRYNSESSKEQLLLIFFFRNYVIVEGSNTGFGCQIFKLEKFKKSFGMSFFIPSANNTIKETSFEPFRGGSSGRTKSLTHYPPGWEDGFELKFKQVEIFKDRIVKKSIETKRKENFSGDDQVKIISGIEPIPESIVQFPQNTNVDSVVSYLKIKNFEVFDRRDADGKVWVIDHPNLMKEFSGLNLLGHRFVPSKSGSKTTSYRPAWYLGEEKGGLKKIKEVVNIKTVQEVQPKRTFDLISYLEQHKFEVIDRRHTGGHLWVIHHPNFSNLTENLEKSGFKFKFEKNGAKATSNTPAWYLVVK